MDGGAQWVTVDGVAKTQTRLSDITTTMQLGGFTSSTRN